MRIDVDKDLGDGPVEQIIASNVRLPETVIGDFHAQIAACLRGRALLELSMDELAQQFAKVTTSNGAAALPGPEPISARTTLQGQEYIVRGGDREALASVGEVSTPNLSELFVALIGQENVEDHR